MTHQTHIEQLAGREAARARARASLPATEHEDDAVPARGSAHVVEITDGAWTIGSVVAGRFVLQKRLGRGRYGPIYRALDRSLSEALIGVEHHVALQEMHPRIATQATLIERLEQLPSQPQSWSHPNIVKVLEFGRDGAKYFLCEELLEGASLRLVLDASAPDPVPLHEVLGVLRSVGDALNYAHAKGVVHGDLRPENVFVTETYKVKVLGLLPSSEPRTTPVFAEDATTGGQPHPSDDVFGLACLAYELLTGRHPYNRNSPLEALRAGLSPHPVLALEPLRWQALSRGLALRRERRTASVPELLAGLGVTGTETLRPPAKDAQPPPPPPAQPAQRAEPAAWPEITDAVASADAYRGANRDAARVVAPPTAAESISARPAPAFAEIYAEPSVRAVRRHPAVHRPRAVSVRTIFAAVFAIALATLVYLDQERLRVQAGDLIETATGFAAQQMARWQAQPTARPPAPSAAGGIDTAGGGAESSPTPNVHAIEPPAASPAAVPPEPLPDETAARTTAPATGAATSDAAADVQLAPAPPAAPIPQPAPARQPAPVAATQPPASPSRFDFAERVVTVNESEPSARIVIRRTGSVDTEAAIVWWADEGTARADQDYAVLGARIEAFAPGQETRVVHVPLIADSVPERRESFVVNLRTESPRGSAAQVEVVVVDDDR